MKAIRIHEYGPPDVLVLDDVPQPVPNAGEVLVRVHAASVNTIDWKIRAGHLRHYVPHAAPFIPGCDMSGVIEAVGQGTRLHVGDEVYGFVNHAYAEHVVAKESEIAGKPRSIDHVAAAALPVAALAAWQALFETAKLRRGEKVLIQGGSGGVGSFAVQLAKWKGAYVGATASHRSQAVLCELGVDQPIDYQCTQFEDVLDGFDVVFDCVGGDVQTRSWAVLRKGGRLVSIAGPPSPEEAVKRHVRAGFVRTRPDARQLDRIARLVDAGKLRPRIAAVFALEDAPRAHELSETGRIQGKVVLVP